MFTNIKKLFLGAAPTNSTAVYTAPAAALSQTQITRIKAHNTGAIQASVELRDNHATNNLLYNLTILAGDTVEIADEWQLNAGEAIFAKASAAGINLYIAGREYTE